MTDRLRELLLPDPETRYVFRPDLECDHIGCYEAALQEALNAGMEAIND